MTIGLVVMEHAEGEPDRFREALDKALPLVREAILEAHDRGMFSRADLNS